MIEIKFSCGMKYMCGQVDSFVDLLSKCSWSHKERSASGSVHLRILVGFREVIHRIPGGEEGPKGL